MELTVGASREPAVEDLDIEIVERKGLGHPDTVCDALAEELSRSLSRFYVDRFGMILHHNVDKVLLRAGSATPRFAGGEVLEPMEIYLAGRATREFDGVRVPLEELAVEGSRSWLRRNFHALDADRHVRLSCLVRPGASDLVDLYQRGSSGGRWLANDTSIGVGFGPASELERIVTAVEERLNSSASRTSSPEVGEDVKVMGVRRREHIGLTVSCAFVGRFLSGAADYLEKKDRVRTLALETARNLTSRPVSVDVNAADDPARGSFYLTVTGTSAEAGDDGEAGRGNRVNGLITPYRPMALEAAAGKNPVTHVGKLYQVACNRICESLVAGIPGVEAAECSLVSRIGRRVSDPQTADIRLRLRDGRRPGDVAAEADAIVRSQLARLENLWREFLEGRIRVY